MRSVLTAFVLILALTGSGERDRIAFIPLPELGTDPVTLRVVHAVNPRLNRITDDELQTLLAETRHTVKTHFNIDLKFEMQPDTTVEKLLALVPAEPWAIRRREIYDFKSGGGDRDLLVGGMVKALTLFEKYLNDTIAYARPYLTTALKENSIKALAEAAITTHLERLVHWKNLKTRQGEAVIDATAANEYLAWDLMGYGNLPYDLVITNQLVVSAEYDDADLSASLRGGVTTGATHYSRAGPFRAWSYLSTFPFIEPAAIPKALGGVPDRAQAIRIAGQYASHEIGHLLLHLSHPFGNPRCVMRAAQVLDYARWSRRLKAKRCRLGSSRAMTPGAAKIRYRTDW
jgi:hypothetical protein